MTEDYVRSTSRRSGCRLVVLAAMCIITTGCASLIRPSGSWRQGGPGTQPVAVSSEPAGAAVFRQGQFLGVTPTTVYLNRRNATHVLRIEKDGFRTVDVPVKRRLSPLLAGNAVWPVVGVLMAAGSGRPDAESRAVRYAVLFPAVGVGVDLLTGAGFTLPSRLHVTLESQDGSSKTPGW